MRVCIILCGASSVGKTTLANDWREVYGKDFSFIEEVARQIMRQNSFTREGLKESLKSEEKTDFLKLQRLIIEAQNRRELDAGPDCSYISDRGPDPLIFTQYYVGQKAADELAVNPAAKACLERYRECLVVVLCPLEAPTEDGVRLTLGSREAQEFTQLLCELLDKYQIRYVYLDETDRRKRVHILEQAVKDFKNSLWLQV